MLDLFVIFKHNDNHITKLIEIVLWDYGYALFFLIVSTIYIEPMFRRNQAKWVIPFVLSKINGKKKIKNKEGHKIILKKDHCIDIIYRASLPSFEYYEIYRKNWANCKSPMDSHSQGPSNQSSPHVRSSCIAVPQSRWDADPWSHGKAQAPSFYYRPRAKSTSWVVHSSWISICLPREPRGLNQSWVTFVFCAWVFLCLKLGINISALVDKGSLICFPAEAERFALGGMTRWLVSNRHIVSIRWRLLFSVAKNH